MFHQLWLLAVRAAKWGREGRGAGAGAGSALPAVTWAASRSAFNRLPAVRRYRGQTNLSLLCAAATLANMFVAIISPLRRVRTSPRHRSFLLREECGERRGNVYLSVDLKSIMILN